LANRRAHRIFHALHRRDGADRGGGGVPSIPSNYKTTTSAGGGEVPGGSAGICGPEGPAGSRKVGIEMSSELTPVHKLMKEGAAAPKGELRRMDILPQVQPLVTARMADRVAETRAEFRTWRWISFGTALAAAAAVVLVVVSLQRQMHMPLTYQVNSG